MTPQDAPPQFSILVPVYNEVDSLRELHRELNEVMDRASGTHEIVFVNDGSSDGSEEMLDELASEDSRVRVLHFSNNCGKSAAYMAGFATVRGQVILTLDADLQDNPYEIPRMLAALKGHDLVVGWKRNRQKNEPLKKIPSFFYNGMKGLLFGLHLHDSNCGFRAMRRPVALALDLFGDRYRFIPELAHRRGFRVTEIPVRHRKRKFGVSKYGPRRFITGFLDLVTIRFTTAFAHKPMHFLGSAGLLPMGLGILLELYVLAQKIFFGSTFQTHVAAIVVGVMLILVGVQLVATGLLGEMISERSDKSIYTIKSRKGFGDHG